MCVDELLRPAHDNRVITHHLMTFRPSVRPVLPSTFVQFGSSAGMSCVLYCTYIHTSQLGSVDLFPSPHFTYLLTYLHMYGLRRVD